MPTIYDNIDKIFIKGLRGALVDARRADFCVGYFNLRGWGGIAAKVEELPNGCRLLIGMSTRPEKIVRHIYNSANDEADIDLTNEEVNKEKKAAVEHFAKQLTYGCPTTADEHNLKMLARQLRENKVTVKFHGRHALHAKLYLVHRQDTVAALAGFVGSSNLTFSGLKGNGELNIDVLDQDAAQKLAAWFEARWGDRLSIDVSQELAEVIENSWAEGPVRPYYIYLKTALHLSQDAVTGAAEYPLPRLFRNKMLDFQARGVELAAALLAKQNGVIIGDVVGLGKTIVASAVAKTFQEREGDSVLIICPPKLQDMWDEYRHNYQIASDILPHSKLQQLKHLRRYKLLVIDESHNFRNRKSKRFAYLRDYIAANDSRVVLLTATPYNMAFTDIANQLRLFMNPDKDLGVRPDNLLRNSGGVSQFEADYPNTPLSSLAAFEQSDYVDDWRELMRLFMVRRTRVHIKEHYAEYDTEKKRHYLLFRDGNKFYFPDRTPKRLAFSLKVGEDDDDYAKLYSSKVVEIIGRLLLPRYGLAEYLRDDIIPPKEDKQIISNLTRAGPRLRGFTRSGLFKRLESGGEAFLLSIDRHILRNNIHLAALSASDGALPIGQINLPESEESAEEMTAMEIAEDGMENGTEAAQIYQTLQTESSDKYDWVSCDYFEKGILLDALQKDNALLAEIRALVPQWRAEKDRKLQALFDLVQKTHGTEKVLVFSQYKDTVNYLHRELSQKGVCNIAAAHGGSDGIQDIIGRFSPRSNNKKPGASELRVLIATDALSEGQNLQDAHIVVNYDLPWALIRLVQRAGRVDRIGQTSPHIYCYSAMPEDGIERVIDLRLRLRGRLQKNEELIGSDERFFEGDEATNRQQLQGLYDGTANLEEPEDETDLISRAYDIWQRATKDNKALADKIRKLPDVVYSAKTTKEKAGVIAYICDGRGHDILAHIDENGEIISQAQAHILDMLECAPEAAATTPAENHHDLVKSGVKELEATAAQTLGGQLGGRLSARRRLSIWLDRMAVNAESRPLLFSEEDKEQLRQAKQDVYDRPLTETARGMFRQLFREGANDAELHRTLAHFMAHQKLCFDAADDDNRESHIICSMGLSND